MIISEIQINRIIFRRTVMKFKSFLKFVSTLFVTVLCVTLSQESVSAEDAIQYLPDDNYSFAIVEVLTEDDEQPVATFYLSESDFRSPDIYCSSSRYLYGVSKIYFRVQLKEGVDFKIMQEDPDHLNTPNFDNAEVLSSGAESEEYNLELGVNDGCVNFFLYQFTLNGVTYSKNCFDLIAYPEGYYDVSLELHSSTSNSEIEKLIYDYTKSEDEVTIDVSTLLDGSVDTFTVDGTNIGKMPKINGYQGWDIEEIVAEGDNYYTVEIYSDGENKEFKLILKNKETTPWENPFLDVDTSSPYYNCVKYCNMNNLILGTSDTTFTPDKIATRAMVVTLLYRLAGNPEVDIQNKFVDISAEDWYYNAVLWANSNSIVTGYDSEHFGPNDNITREQFATILYRYLKMLYPDMIFNNYMYSIYDNREVSDYASEAMEFATYMGVLKMTDAKVAAKDNVTRGDLAMSIAAMNVIVLPKLAQNPVISFYGY